MGTPNVALCPDCGSAHLNWRVQRIGRRGQPLAGRQILWSCGACGASWVGGAEEPSVSALLPDEQAG
jgi:ribosomal protein L37AE/L43A